MVLNPRFGKQPGTGATRESLENALVFAEEHHVISASNRHIVSTAVDAGNSPTTELRAGLLLTVDSNGKYAQWTGTGPIEAIVRQPIPMLDTDGVAKDTYTQYITAGPVVAADLLINGTAFVGNALEHLARQIMGAGGRFLFDDVLYAPELMQPCNSTFEEAKTAAYSIVAADNGKEFTNLGASGAVTLTLPPIEAGLHFRIRNRSSGNNITVARAGSDTISTSSNDSATSISVNTLGTTAYIYANAAGNKWYHDL